ncbi:MAG: winged helix DNA-binding protein [Firmicutes bacterium]|nr:winged helix DNA-binding protein [Bacillota bacterium]
MDLKASLIELQCEMVAERNLVNPREITWLQYDILCRLKKGGEILPSDLSLVLGVSRTKLSKALRGLKSMGYIEQIPNKLDGRELYTSLTEGGDALLEDISKRHSALYRIAAEHFTEEEQEEFIRLSGILSDELRKARMGRDE